MNVNMNYLNINDMNMNNMNVIDQNSPMNKIKNLLNSLNQKVIEINEIIFLLNKAYNEMDGNIVNDFQIKIEELINKLNSMNNPILNRNNNFNQMIPEPFNIEDNIGYGDNIIDQNNFQQNRYNIIFQLRGKRKNLVVEEKTSINELINIFFVNYFPNIRDEDKKKVRFIFNGESIGQNDNRNVSFLNGSSGSTIRIEVLGPIYFE